jgi:elongation factor P
MVSGGDFKKGLTIEIDGAVWVIVDFQHVKPGKGPAFVRTKMKNIMTGTVLEKTINPAEKFPRAMVERKQMEYLYNDGELYYFMDSETFEQIPLNRDKVEAALPYMKENMVVEIKFFKDSAFSVEPPNFVELEVTETDPGFKGDTATAGNKPAIVETGAKIMVPIFISTGEKIRVDTRSGEYMERV